jgi:hypothetical protein
MLAVGAGVGGQGDAGVQGKALPTGPARLLGVRHCGGGAEATDRLLGAGLLATRPWMEAAAYPANGGSWSAMGSVGLGSSGSPAAAQQPLHARVDLNVVHDQLTQRAYTTTVRAIPTLSARRSGSPPRRHAMAAPTIDRTKIGEYTRRPRPGLSRSPASPCRSGVLHSAVSVSANCVWFRNVTS